MYKKFEHYVPDKYIGQKVLNLYLKIFVIFLNMHIFFINVYLLLIYIYFINHLSATSFFWHIKSLELSQGKFSINSISTLLK